MTRLLMRHQKGRGSAGKAVMASVRSETYMIPIRTYERKRRGLGNKQAKEIRKLDIAGNEVKFSDDYSSSSDPARDN